MKDMRKKTVKPDWSAIIPDLGKMSDYVLASKHGISQTAVRIKRNALGIPAYGAGIVWTEQMLAELGKVYDSAFAGKYNISRPTVRSKRIELGIPKRTAEMSDQLLAELGKASDLGLARKYNHSYSAVRNKRRELGIPMFVAELEWTEQMLAELGKKSDCDLVSILNLSHYVINKKRCSLGIPRYVPEIDWTDQMLADLGKMKDKDLAKKHKVSLKNVSAKRVALGIPIFGRVIWTEQMLAALGDVSDGKIAKIYNLSRESVIYKRRKLGIPSKRKIAVWTDDMINDLGKIRNKDFCIKYKLNSTSIPQLKIKELGIASYRARHVLINWTPEILAALGTMADRRLANKFDISEGLACAKRIELGIPAFKKRIHSSSENKAMQPRTDGNTIRENYQNKLNYKMGVVKLAEQGLTRVQIARQLDVTTGNIARILDTDPDVQELIRKNKGDSPAVTQENILESSIDILDVPFRIKSTLKMSNLNTIGSLVSRTKAELLKVPNFNLKSFNHLELELEAHGLSVAPAKYVKPAG